MKRKSTRDTPAKRKKGTEAYSSNVLIREGVDFTHVDIPPGKGVVFSGNATLEVTSGCVQVYGCVVTPERGLVKLTAPSKYSKALLITAVAEAIQAPLAQSTSPVQVVLHASAAAAGEGDLTVLDSSSTTSTAVWQVPQQWAQATDTLCASLTTTAAATAAGPATRPVVIAITGSKGSGKSSVARLLVNSLLNICAEVAFLDLDPGQPELTPPGLLSLHLLQHPLFGPPHLQNQQPLLAYFQGDLSSQSEPARYLQAVQSLCSRYQSMAAATAAAGEQAIPLVINTPGWITGLGLELLVEVLRCAAPTHVLNMQLPNSKKNLPDGCWWLDGNAAAAAAAAAGAVLPTVLQLPSVSAAAASADTTAAAAAASSGVTVPAGSGFSAHSGETGATTNLGSSSSGKSGRTLSAAESRTLSWLSWSQRVIHSSSSNGNAELAIDPENSNAAAADGSSTADEFAAAAGLAAVGLAAAVPYEVSLHDLDIQLLHAQVHQSEIAFAVNGSVVGLVSSSSQQQQQQQDGVATGEIPECLGLGLVRAVDSKNGVLYLLTDLIEDRLDLVDTLVVGRLEFPEKLLVTQTFATPYQGLYCLTSTATGAGVIKARNNLLRVSMLRG